MSARAVESGGSPPAQISANRRLKPRGGGEETGAGAVKGGNGAPEIETETGTSADIRAILVYIEGGSEMWTTKIEETEEERERARVCAHTSCARMPGDVPSSRRLPPSPPPWVAGEPRRSGELGWDWRMESETRGAPKLAVCARGPLSPG